MRKSDFRSLFSTLSAFALALALLLALPALAAESAGVILAFTGKVDVERNAGKLPAARMAQLYSGDTISVAEGQVQVRFADGTLLTLYRNTRFSVDEYHYGKGNGDRAQFSLVNGLMHTLTGKIDKKNYLIKTRLANLGVRGTEYSASLDEMLHVNVNTGRVAITNAAGTLLVNAGGSAMVTGANSIPRPGGGRIDLHGAGQGAGQGAGGDHPGGSSAPPPPPPPSGTQNISGQQAPQPQPPPQAAPQPAPQPMPPQSLPPGTTTTQSPPPSMAQPAPSSAQLPPPP